MIDVKDCPFCGGKSSYLENSNASGGSRGIIKCFDCDSGTPYVLNKAEAIEKWNSRINKKVKNND